MARGKTPDFHPGLCGCVGLWLRGVRNGWEVRILVVFAGGVPRLGTESKPFEPDPGDAGVGNATMPPACFALISAF